MESKIVATLVHVDSVAWSFRGIVKRRLSLPGSGSWRRGVGVPRMYGMTSVLAITSTWAKLLTSQTWDELRLGVLRTTSRAFGTFGASGSLPFGRQVRRAASAYHANPWTATHEIVFLVLR